MANISELKFDHKNARKRTDSSARLIQESLQRYGAARSIVIDEDNRILAGNGTIEAAKALGLAKLKVVEADGDEIIAVRRSGLSEDDKVGLALADNRAAELSDWDAEMLQQLSEEHDIAPWFEQEDLEALLEQAEQLPAEGNTDPDDVPETPEDPITKPGDLWILGNHRLLCGDSTNPQHVERLMDGKKAEMVFTDPPYGMFLENDRSDLVRTDPSGWKSTPKQYKNVIGDHEDFSPELIQAIFAAAPNAKEVFIWGADYFAELLPNRNDGSWIAWDKRVEESLDTMMGSMFELCWSKSRHKREIARVRWVGFHGTEQEHDHKRVHPTQKPTALAEWFFEKWGKRLNVVLDLYGGSGSTLIACEKTSRQCRMMELDPSYCDVIVKRWEDFTGNTAICQPSADHFIAEQQEAF